MYLVFSLQKHQFAGFNSCCDRNSFSFRDALGSGTWLICHRNTPFHIILNCDYLSIPRLYVPFHPAVYRISGEAAAREIKQFIRLFFILQITRSKDQFSSLSL